MTSFAVFYGPATFLHTKGDYGYSWHDAVDDVSCSGDEGEGWWIWANSWKSGDLRPACDCSHSWALVPGQSTREASR